MTDYRRKFHSGILGEKYRMVALGIILAFAVLKESHSLAISHNDLEEGNETCSGRGSCESHSRDPRLSDDVSWIDRNCMCDKLCARYGDCCVDSPHFLSAEQRRGAATFSCVDLRQFRGIYMVTTCPPGRGSMKERKKCEELDPSDPLSTLPVTSHKTGITYRNAQCALCHNDLNKTKVDFWKAHLECSSLLPSLTTRSPKNLTSYLKWNVEKNSWGLDLQNWVPCTIDPALPETSVHIVRRCQADVVHTCAVNWTNSDVRNRCEAYTSLVYSGRTPYRNPHCAVCNKVPLQRLACVPAGVRIFSGKEFALHAFSVLFDLSGKDDSVVGKVKPCRTNQLYDPFFKKCRDVICPSMNFTDGECVVEDLDEDVSNDEFDNDLDPGHQLPYLNQSQQFNLSKFDLCPKFLLDPEDYSFSDDTNMTIYISAYDKYFSDDEFKVFDDRSVELCVGTLGTRYLNKFGQYMGYITSVGLGVSIFFLVLHLIIFLCVPELQNLSGKNLASLCVALLLAYSSFISGQCIPTGTDSCIVLSIITHYAFLTSFSWMLTMSFDIWRTLKLATFELRVSSGKQWKKFMYYSIWSWTAPIPIVIASTATDFAPPETVNIYLRPLYGVHSCWFGHRQALLLFFAAPLALVMILNIFFFASSAHMVLSTTSTTRYTASGATQRDFRLYIRLALVMGLTWISGLLAGYLDVEILWYAFVALNTLQGLFIFLAFTCNDKVLRSIRESIFNQWDDKESGDKDRRPPSFSWSGGSSDTTNKSNLESTSDDSGKLKNFETKFNYDSAPRSKSYQDNLQNDYETEPNSYDSRSKIYNLNSRIGYESNLRNSKNYDAFPQSGFINYGSNPKINPIYGSAKPETKNTTYDKRHLDDTLY